LRAKLGDKVLQPLQEAEAEKKKAAEQEKAKRAGQSAPGPNSAPILPPDLDSSLPPPPRHRWTQLWLPRLRASRQAPPRPNRRAHRKKARRLRDLKIPVLLKPRLRRRREEFDCGGVSLPQFERLPWLPHRTRQAILSSRRSHDRDPDFRQ